MKALLEWDDVNPNTPDEGGRTPLSLAGENANEGILRMLLKRSDVYPALADRLGQTPGSWGVISEDDEVVRVLRE